MDRANRKRKLNDQLMVMFHVEQSGAVKVMFHVEQLGQGRLFCQR